MASISFVTGTIVPASWLNEVNAMLYSGGGTAGYVWTSAAAGSAAGWAPTAGATTWGSITGTLSNQTDLQTALDARLLVADIDDVPVNGVTNAPISSNWAFDHEAAADPHTGYRLESADHNHQSTGLQAGQLDHGLALTGLTDDDHTQYLLATGARAGSTAGAQSFGTTGIATDVIAESTGAAGVTVDGVLLKDSYITLPEVSAPGTAAANTMRLYNVDRLGKSILTMVSDDGVTMELAQDNYFLARNNTGLTINKGTPVYVTGVQGSNRPTIGLADADTDATSVVVGLTGEDISNNADGRVMFTGVMENVDTSAFNEGEILYLSSTAGALTATPPAHPAIIVRCATVLTDHATQGRLLLSLFTRLRTLDGTILDTFILGSSATDRAVLDITASSLTASRTFTFPDNNGELLTTSHASWTDLTDSGATTLHKHDHGGMDGLGDDDHALYLLASDATNRTTFATNWADLTDSGETTLHTHPSTAVSPLAPGGRITLSTATPVMVADVSNATTVYYTPYVHNKVPLYDGSVFTMTTFTELSQTTTDSTKSPAAVGNNLNYDIFVWSDGGTIRATRGPAWSSDTARGTGAGTTELTRVLGVLLNAVDITNGPAAQRGTYVGSIRSDGSAQIDWEIGGSAAAGDLIFLGVWNCYNRVTQSFRSLDTTDSWTYSTATWRSANNSTAMRASMIRGLNEDGVIANYQAISSQSTTEGRWAGVGLDSTSTPTGRTGGPPAITNTSAHQGEYSGVPGLGFHFVQALEYSQGAGTTTWYGDAGVAFIQNGFSVSCRH